jgi:adenosylcobinamide-GDP ribazoletransferase
VRDLRLAFGFFTVIPVSHREGTMKGVASTCYLLPLVALAIGALAGLAGWGSTAVWNDPVAAAVTLVLLLLLTGFHHADGLADFGDALMARGGRARRIEVLKDRTLGVGGVGALLLTYLVTWAALIELFASVDGAGIIWYLVAAEVSARMALLLTALFSSPSHEGSGSEFIAAVKGWRGFTGIVVSLAVLALIAIPTQGAATLIAAGAALLVALSISITGRQWFGGVGGDLLGAAVEVGRMAALLGLAAALNAWPPS